MCNIFIIIRVFYLFLHTIFYIKYMTAYSLPIWTRIPWVMIFMEWLEFNIFKPIELEHRDMCSFCSVSVVASWHASLFLSGWMASCKRFHFPLFKTRHFYFQVVEEASEGFTTVGFLVSTSSFHPLGLPTHVFGVLCSFVILDYYNCTHIFLNSNILFIVFQ